MLSNEATRVLGCLVEKAMTTPDYYPMTANALRTAANQSTNRDPVVDFDDTTITRAITELQDTGLARAVHAPGQRSVKYRHAVNDVLGLEPPQAAVLAVLLLRGEQTPGELRGRTERYLHFDSPSEVGLVLDALASRDEPLVAVLERRPGEKESRWRHLLSTRGVSEPTEAPSPPEDSADETVGDEGTDRLGELESMVADLQRRVRRLESERSGPGIG